MDRQTPILLCSSLYALFCYVCYWVVSCPVSLLAKDKAKEHRDFYGQHISLVHSVIAVALAIWVYFQDGGVIYESQEKQAYINVLGHSLGYFLYDMIYAEIYQIHDWPMRLHHTSTLLAGFVFYIDPRGGSIGICKFQLVCIVIAEFSNPFMLLRHIMKAKGLNKIWFYDFCEIAFASTFTGLRTIGGFLLNINIWKSPVSVLAKFNVSILFGISLFWISVIVAMFVKKEKERNPNLTGLVKALSEGSSWLKRHSILFMAFLLTAAVLVPVWAQYYMELGYRHIRLGQFIVA